MEPGHEDREYSVAIIAASTGSAASMEPGHEDREYGDACDEHGPYSPSLNGARS